MFTLNVFVENKLYRIIRISIYVLYSSGSTRRRVVDKNYSEI